VFRKIWQESFSVDDWRSGVFELAVDCFWYQSLVFGGFQIFVWLVGGIVSHAADFCVGDIGD
jgi:hypothetical protein